MRSHVFNALARHPALARPRRHGARKAAAIAVSPAPVSASPVAATPPRVAPSKTPRFLTMSTRRWHRATAREAVVPYLRMSGRWLEEHGFPIGGSVHVTVEQGRVVLTNDAAAVAEASLDVA
jgi:hypothetical protein